LEREWVWVDGLRLWCVEGVVFWFGMWRLGGRDRTVGGWLVYEMENGGVGKAGTYEVCWLRTTASLIASFFDVVLAVATLWVV
jgi:hypothetical protein